MELVAAFKAEPSSSLRFTANLLMLGREVRISAEPEVGAHVTVTTYSKTHMVVMTAG